ncbi:hypothetical protein RKD23_007790 [Streptomyces sp. SAI-170]|uniref:DUF1877 family protein n=1 Tax=Streptomyces sp. SAI-170 TaxID=3377729 RepID=UPI003C7B6CA1
MTAEDISARIGLSMAGSAWAMTDRACPAPPPEPEWRGLVCEVTDPPRAALQRTMNTNFHFRVVPPPALRNSATWMRRLFDDGPNAVRGRMGRHREEVLDGSYLDHEVLYTGVPPHEVARGPQAQVVLGGRPILHPDPRKAPFLLLTPGRTAQVAAYLATADFEVLWQCARNNLMTGTACPEEHKRQVLASAHENLTVFYATAAVRGDAVVKWLETGNGVHA